MARIRIGCSGWSYRDWRGPFYPQELRQKDWFSFYAGQFDTTEINASFYRLPSEAAVANWAATADAGHGLGGAGGWNEHYRTCLCILLLEVYYRFLPGTGGE